MPIKFPQKVNTAIPNKCPPNSKPRAKRNAKAKRSSFPLLRRIDKQVAPGSVVEGGFHDTLLATVGPGIGVVAVQNRFKILVHVVAIDNRGNRWQRQLQLFKARVKKMMPGSVDGRAGGRGGGGGIRLFASFPAVPHEGTIGEMIEGTQAQILAIDPGARFRWRAGGMLGEISAMPSGVVDMDGCLYI